MCFVVEEEPAAHLGPAVGGTHLVDEPVEGEGGDAQSDASGEDGAAGTRIGEAESRGVDEADGERREDSADVLVNVGDVADIALTVGQRAVAAPGFGHCGELVSLRMPVPLENTIRDVTCELPRQNRAQTALGTILR
jgi:hypothetical protein